MPKRFINPDTLFPSLGSGFSQVVAAQGREIVHISGQTAWNAERRIVGGKDLTEQARQALRNTRVAVEAAGGSLADIVSLRIYVVDYTPDLADGISSVLREFFPDGERRPASTWIGVSALAVPDFLIEIEATAVLE